MRTHISIANTPDEIAAIRTLCVEYATSLPINLDYQGFTAELDGLPGAYAAPRGRLLLAKHNGAVAGCVALRPHNRQHCEMKRLYVRPEFQGSGIGRKLVERLVSEARAIGYSMMLLDTLSTMHGALGLYASLGFVRRTPYFESPLADNVFMELNLSRDAEHIEKS